MESNTFLKAPANSRAWLLLFWLGSLLSSKPVTLASGIQDHLGQAWVKWPLGVPGHRVPPASPSPTTWTERRSDVVLHGDTGLPKFSIQICLHSRRRKRIWLFRLQNQRLKINFYINRQRKAFLLWLQSRVSCSIKDIKMKTELDCCIL